MPHNNLKKILAGYSIAGLLTATFSTTGCSKPDEPADKPVDQKISQQPSFPGEEDQKNAQKQSVLGDEPLEKPTDQNGKEVKIRGKSG